MDSGSKPCILWYVGSIATALQPFSHHFSSRLPLTDSSHQSVSNVSWAQERRWSRMQNHIHLLYICYKQPNWPKYWNTSEFILYSKSIHFYVSFQKVRPDFTPSSVTIWQWEYLTMIFFLARLDLAFHQVTFTSGQKHNELANYFQAFAKFCSTKSKRRHYVYWQYLWH